MIKNLFRKLPHGQVTTMLPTVDVKLSSTQQKFNQLENISTLLAELNSHMLIVFNTVILQVKILTLSQSPHHTLLAEKESTTISTISFSLASTKFQIQMFSISLYFTRKRIVSDKIFQDHFLPEEVLANSHNTVEISHKVSGGKFVMLQQTNLI